MLSRILNTTVKVVRIAHITNNGRGHTVPAFLLSQKCNYATAVKMDSMEYTIIKMKNRMAQKSNITLSDLQSLFLKIETQKLDSVQALDILTFCSYARTEQDQTGISKSIWETMKKQNTPFQVQHYNRFMQLASHKKNPTLAQEIFDELIKDGIKPDVMSYKYLLSSYCAAGDIENAIQILEMMDQDNLYIDKESLNSLTQCHILCGNIDAANETIEILKQNKHQMNIYTFKAFLTHYANAGDMDNIQKTFDLFKEHNLQLLNRDILNVICILAENGKMDQIDSLLSKLTVNLEMRRSLQNVIKSFVENHQSVQVLKIIQLLDGNIVPYYKHLIEEMVRLSSSEAELEEIFEKIEANGIKIETHFDVFSSAIDGQSLEIIRKLLAHMQSHSMEVTENIFVKLFQLSAKKGTKEVLDAVHLMCTKFKIQPQMTFVRDVILPSLNGNENLALAYANLQSTQLNIRTTLFAIIIDRLNDGDIKAALNFATTDITAFYATDMVNRSLIKAYATTGDVSSFVSLVRLMGDSFSSYNNYYRKNQIAEAETLKKRKEFVGEMLFSAIVNRCNDLQLITQLLEAFVEEGLSINANVAAKIKTQLQVDDNTQVGRLLKKLCSGNLTLKSVRVEKFKPTIMSQLSSADVHNVMKVREARGCNETGTEKVLFTALLREGNIAEIEALLAKNKFSLNNKDYSLLNEVYTKAGQLENALITLKRACANNASFKLHPIKVGRLVTLMVDNDRAFEDIEALLIAHHNDEFNSRVYLFESLLDRLAATGQKQFVQKLFDALLKYNYIEATNDSCGPLVLASIKNGGPADAVSKFQHFANTYKLVPMAMVLFCHLIRENEIDLLQNAYDTYETVRGTSNALSRLGFAFVECGQERQATVIFENEQIKNLSRSIASECEMYKKFGRLESAETLLKATKEIYCDRHIIYGTILDIYCKQNMAQEALELWYEYSTDGILPEKKFKIQLADLLKANNMGLPFDLEINKTGKSNRESVNN